MSTSQISLHDLISHGRRAMLRDQTRADEVKLADAVLQIKPHDVELTAGTRTIQPGFCFVVANYCRKHKGDLVNSLKLKFNLDTLYDLELILEVPKELAELVPSTIPVRVVPKE